YLHSSADQAALLAALSPTLVSHLAWWNQSAISTSPHSAAKPRCLLQNSRHSVRCRSDWYLRCASLQAAIKRAWRPRPSPVARIMRQHLSQEASNCFFTGRSVSTALCCSSRPAFTTQPLPYETMVGRLKKTNLRDRKEPRSLPGGFRQHRFRTIHIGQKVRPKFMGA